MTPILIELGYLGFEVADLQRWERFATEVLGLGVSEGLQGSRLLRMDDAPARFILRSGPADELAFIGWKVNSPAELDAFARHLDTCGLQACWGGEDELALRHAARLLHFQDPEGNRHEVYLPTPSAMPPYVSATVASGFVTGAGGAGHVVLEAADYPAMIAFARDVLGMRLSDHIDLQPAPGVQIEISFFHANERHHSLAIAPQPPGPGPKKRIHHFMLEAATMPDVGLARDRCLAFGLPVVMDIGQHPNDRMVSFYARTPSGFLFELGWGGVKVNDATWQPARYGHVSNWGHRPYGVMPGDAGVMPPSAVEVA